MITFGSLFAGIGGFDLGLERAGMKCLWQVEIDDYCNKVLEKHWSEVRRYKDVKECGKENLEPVDLICGGVPCQPASVAGKRRGEKDDRWLWPEAIRIVKELKPRWVVFENPPGLLSLKQGTLFDQVLSDLEDSGYETGTINIPACGFNAPHRRYRIFIVAHSLRVGCTERSFEPAVQSKEQVAERSDITELCEVVADTNTGRCPSEQYTRSGAAQDRRGQGNPVEACADVVYTAESGCRRGCNTSEEYSKEGQRSEEDRQQGSRSLSWIGERSADVADPPEWQDDQRKPGNVDEETGGGEGIYATFGDGCSDVSNPEPEGLERAVIQGLEGERGWGQDPHPSRSDWWSVEPSVCELVNGFSDRLVRFRGRTARGIPNRVNKLRALGNAVVPQVVEWLGKIIIEVDRQAREMNE